MTKNELKSEIVKTLDSVPDSALNDVLQYLKSLQGKSADELRLSQKLRVIMTEDKELLEKLAK